MRKFGYVLTAPNTAVSRLMGNMLGIASGFRSKISLSNENWTLPLNEISKKKLDLLCGNKVTVTVEGQDEEAAVAAIQNYFVSCM